MYLNLIMNNNEINRNIALEIVEKEIYFNYNMINK